MITATDLEQRAGARLLLEPVSFRVQPGDRIGLVGRNGAGKTTLTRVLAGETLPASGRVTRPAAGNPSPARILVSVVLPAPLRPTSPTLSPAPTRKVT